jgi:CBS domain-containing protein
MQVKDIMSQPVITVHEEASLEEVAKLMLQHDIGAVPVVDDDGRLVGIITESDFTGKERGFPFSVYRAPQVFGEWITPDGIERIYAAARARKAKEIMSAPVVTAREDEPVTALVERMTHYDLHRIPLGRDGVPVGMVTRHDLLKLMLDSARQLGRTEGPA